MPAEVYANILNLRGYLCQLGLHLRIGICESCQFSAQNLVLRQLVLDLFAKLIEVLRWLAKSVRWLLMVRSATAARVSASAVLCLRASFAVAASCSLSCRSVAMELFLVS